MTTDQYGVSTLSESDDIDESLHAASATHVGLKRSQNEDAVAVMCGEDGLRCLCLVADGMGGMSCGDMASRTAIELAGKAPIRKPGDRKAIVKLFHRIDDAINKAADKSGTTLVLALAAESTLTVAHVGDSRAYLLRGGLLQRLTVDHSWVQSQVDAGRIKPEDADAHPRRNVLIKALGSGRRDEPDIAVFRFSAGDTLLMCTDGLHGCVTDGEIAKVLQQSSDPQQACDGLVALALEHGGPDNVSCVVCKCGQDGAA